MQGCVILEDYGHNNAFGWLLYAFHVNFLQRQVLKLYQKLCASNISATMCPQKSTTYDVKKIRQSF